MAEEKTSGTVSVRQLAMNLKNRQKDFSMTDLLHLQQLLIDGAIYMNIFGVDNIDVFYFTVGDTNSILLPPSFIDYYKISTIDSNGKLWTLTLNKSLVLTPTQECGIPLNLALSGCCETNPETYSYPTDGYGYIGHYYNDSWIPTAYSMGGGFNQGYYRIDRQGRNMIIQGLPQGATVVMEAKTSGINLTSTTFLPKQMTEVLLAWTMWKEAEYGNVKADPNYWRDRFYEEEAVLLNFNYQQVMQEHQDQLWKVWNQGIKR